MGRRCGRPLSGHGPSGLSWLPYESPAGDDRQISSEDRRSVKLRVRPPPTDTHPVSPSDPDRRHNHAHSQVDAKRVDRPPRYWARASREPAMLGIRNDRQPQLDNTSRDKKAARDLIQRTRLSVGIVRARDDSCNNAIIRF